MVSASQEICESTPLQEEIAGGAPCKEIDQGYYPPRKSSMSLNRDGPNLVGRRGLSTRAKKRRTQSFSRKSQRNDIFRCECEWRVRTRNSPYVWCTVCHSCLFVDTLTQLATQIRRTTFHEFVSRQKHGIKYHFDNFSSTTNTFGHPV